MALATEQLTRDEQASGSSPLDEGREVTLKEAVAYALQRTYDDTGD